MLRAPTRGAPRRPRGRSGFTFVEMVVTLAILLLLAAVLLPQVIQRLGQGEAATLATDMDALSDAMRAFRSDVGRYPQRLSYLSSPIGVGAKDSCSGNIPDPGTWKGPYLDRNISASEGLRAGTIIIQDSIGRSPANAVLGPFGILTMRAAPVDRAVADQLEKAFDGDGDLGSGNIRWSEDSPGTGSGTLSFSVPARGC